MTTPSWRFEPLDTKRFALGSGPFRARGLAFVGAMKYIEQRVPGGLDALRAKLGPDDPYLPYYDQLFVVAGEYDVSPLLHLHRVLADLAAAPLASFIEGLARFSGGEDTKGVWRPKLSGGSIGEVAEKLYFAFERYYPPCQARPLGNGPRRFEGELRSVPAPMNGLYTSSTVGFYRGALAGAGASSVRVQFDRPVADGELQGVPTERIRFAVTWDG